MSNDTEPLRIWWNKNLHGKITPMKLAAHAAHAALLAYGIKYTHPIVVLAAGKGRIEAMPINVHDAGRTEIPEGTLTTGVEDESHRYYAAEAYAAGVAEGIRQERERCARVAEADDTWEGDHIAEAIRQEAS